MFKLIKVLLDLFVHLEFQFYNVRLNLLPFVIGLGVGEVNWLGVMAERAVGVGRAVVAVRV